MTCDKTLSTMSNDWHVLGAGAIGSLFACALQDTHQSPVLLSKNSTAAATTRTITLRHRTQDTGRPRCYSFPVSPNNATAPIEKLLLTTKAYDVREAIGQVAHRLNEYSVIVILVNGMGFMNYIQRDHPRLRFTPGTTTEGVYRISENNFCHAGEGITRIGLSGQSHPPDWFSTWETLPINCSWDAGIDEILWQKLAVNCAINPLTAKQRCKNGDLALPEMATQVSELCDEIALVSRAAGYVRTADNIHQQVRTVIAATAENKSSMLQDVLAGRRSEIDYICGYFLTRAEQLGVPAPFNAALYNEIKKMDQFTR